MKAIILAGGTGSRLRPITWGVSKQLLPVYDKPMIYYPLSVLMLAGIREVLVVTTPHDLPMFRRLLGSGEQLGIRVEYAEQTAPRGLPDAFLIGADYVGNEPVALILGDNIFHGPRFPTVLSTAIRSIDEGRSDCVVFGYPVRDPQRYGVADVDAHGRLTSVTEKPASPRSNLAVTGLYFFGGDVVDVARTLTPSARGELEIADLVQHYIERGTAGLVNLGRGFAWLDTGTHESLLGAGEYVRVLENRQGIRIACLEEIAMRMGFIDSSACYALGAEQASSEYGEYVMDVAKAYDAIRDGAIAGMQPRAAGMDVA